MTVFSKLFMPAIVMSCFFYTETSAQTNQFRGVNWSDTRDNFQSGVIYLSGITSADNYASALATSENIIGQFVSKLGTNSVRLPINEATASTFWETYTGVLDGALKKGRVILCYWSKSLGAKPSDMNAYWAMWQKAVTKYGNNPNFYFELYNEPNGYTKADLLSLYEQWLSKFPSIPHGRIILDGTGMAQNIPDVGNDARFKNCLLAVHDYSFWAFFTSEQQWKDHLKGEVGAYSNRTVMTEFGAPMKPGTRDGINYGVQDYSSAPGTYFVAYLRGITSQLRDWKMGSFYWIGLRDNDWYSLTTKSGTGASAVLTINNQSGLDRVQFSWTDTVATTIPVPQAPYKGIKAEIPGKLEMENYDEGGQGVAYSDDDAANQGAAYRVADGVDIQGDAATGYKLAYTKAGEWIEYTVNVKNAEAYNWTANVASGADGASFHILLDSTTNITGSVAIPNGGSYELYKTLTGTTPILPVGTHTLRLMIDGAHCNIDWINFTSNPVSLKISQALESTPNWSGSKVYDLSGNVVGVIHTTDKANLHVQVSQMNLKNGIYIVKHPQGKLSYRVDLTH